MCRVVFDPSNLDVRTVVRIPDYGYLGERSNRVLRNSNAGRRILGGISVETIPIDVATWNPISVETNPTDAATSKEAIDETRRSYETFSREWADSASVIAPDSATVMAAD